MTNNYETKSDQELLIIIITAPQSANAQSAREVLEYRKYIESRKATKRSFWLAIFAIVLSIGNFIITIIEKLIP